MNPTEVNDQKSFTDMLKVLSSRIPNHQIYAMKQLSTFLEVNFQVKLIKYFFKRKISTKPLQNSNPTRN